MQLALFLHTPTQARYIVLILNGIVYQAAGPLTSKQIAAVQRNEWSIPWMPGLGQWVEKNRDEFEQVFPKGA